MLMVLGASHHDLELNELDRLSAGADALSRSLAALSSDLTGPLAGSAVLATCNRLEIYADARRFHDAVDAITAVVADASGLAAETVGSSLKVRVGAPVAAHLFTVAAGLDSMVVGEAEISGQVSRTLRRAQTNGTATPLLNSLFQSASRTAKQVAGTTGLGGAGRSVATVALEIAEQELPGGQLEGTSALIIGTGAYARVVAAALAARGCTALQVFSPSGRARSFAVTHHAEPVDTANLVDALVGADLVVACSGTTGAVLDCATVSAAVARRTRPMLMIDLALHGDIPSEVRRLPGVSVIDLHTVAAQNDPTHAEAILAAQDLVIAAVARFEDHLAVRTLDPAVVALRQHVSETVGKELTRLRAKYTGDVAADVELALHRVTQSLLHTPTLRAQELARTGDSADYLQALHTLFGIEIDQRSAAHGA